MLLEYITIIVCAPVYNQVKEKVAATTKTTTTKFDKHLLIFVITNRQGIELLLLHHLDRTRYYRARLSVD